MQITAIILAGGKSLRMGQDKGLVLHRRKQMVEHVIDACRQITPNIFISTNNMNYKVFGYPLITDNHKGIGPIGGIQAALAVSDTEDNIFCPCDMPEIHSLIFEKILQAREGNQAVVAARGDGKYFPVLGYYRKSALEIVEKQIHKGDFKMQNLLKILNAETVVFADSELVNINHPEDLV